MFRRRQGRKSPRSHGNGDSGENSLHLDGDLLAVLAQVGETHHAVSLGEQGVVGADADIHTGMDVSAALADENVAGLDELAVRPLGTETLGVGITAVLGGAAAFLWAKNCRPI